MRIAILDVRVGRRNPYKSFTVAYRNLISLKEALKADLFCDVMDFKKSSHYYDVIICGFGSTSTEAEKSTLFLKENKKAHLFWLVGEYEQSTFAPLFYANRPYSVIKNFEHPMNGSQIKEQHFLNINLLLLGDRPDIDTAIKNHQYNCIYYGRWRKDRSDYFQKYLQKGVMVSTSVKNMKIFKAYGTESTFCKPLTWKNGRETLRKFRTSLYLEDIFTHSHYNCPANRFYEALTCGSVIIPQRESAHTWDTYGIDMTERYVHDLDSLHDMIRKMNDEKYMKRALKEQEEWLTDAKERRVRMIERFKGILSDAEHD